MCKDCGCSLNLGHSHGENHSHEYGENEFHGGHEHSHENSHSHEHSHAHSHENHAHSHEHHFHGEHSHAHDSEHFHSHSHGENSHENSGHEHSHENSHSHKNHEHSEHSHEHFHSENHGEHAHPTLNQSKTIEVIGKILSKNDAQAQHNREHFNENGVLCLNLMSSPGSGKTTLLEATIKELKGKFNISVIEGDLETENDAKRVREAGAKAHQITTGQSCHLDAFMVHNALHHLDLSDTDLLFIENVGNLVCPASYDLGEHLNVVLLSVTEGDDKPAKYPVMFRKADLVVISKADLASHFDFNTDKAIKECKKLNPKVDVIVLDAKNGTNLELWFKFLKLKKELF